MTEPQALQKLLTWLSPAFPVGAFAWSAGLETAIATRQVHDAATTRDWIEGVLHDGGLRTDAILCARAHAGADNPETLRTLTDLCLALVPASERHAEILAMGAAFVAAARAWPSPALDRLPNRVPYPIAVGALAVAHDIDCRDTLLALLTASVHGQVSVAVRLVPIGQNDGLAIMAALEPAIAAIANDAATATLDEIGAIAYAQDIAQMQHETLSTRIFRS